MASGPERVVRYGPRAESDLAEIYDYTARERGVSQAERYFAFLVETAERAASGEAQVRRLQDVPDALVVMAKWQKARYGHYIVFTEEEAGIYVLRILHGAMDISARLNEITDLG